VSKKEPSQNDAIYIAQRRMLKLKTARVKHVVSDTLTRDLTRPNSLTPWLGDPVSSLDYTPIKHHWNILYGTWPRVNYSHKLTHGKGVGVDNDHHKRIYALSASRHIMPRGEAARIVYILPQTTPLLRSYAHLLPVTQKRTKALKYIDIDICLHLSMHAGTKNACN